MSEANVSVLTGALEVLQDATPQERAFVRPAIWDRMNALGAQYDKEKRCFFIEEEVPEEAEAEAEAPAKEAPAQGRLAP